MISSLSSLLIYYLVYPVEMQDVVVFVFAWVPRVDVRSRTLGYFWRGNVLL